MATGFPIIADACKVIPGTIQSCSAILKENHLLAISPGGVYEAQFSSSSTYNILWKKRLGFAKVAIDAKCVSGNFFNISLIIYNLFKIPI